jgi:hypothetical protein
VREGDENIFENGGEKLREKRRNTRSLKIA